MRNILFTLVLLGLAACGGASREQLLVRAQGYIEKSDFEAATIELENALQLDSNSAETRWLLGKVYLETGHVLEAQYELEQAQLLGWTNDDLRPALAQTLLAQGKNQDVLALDYQGLNTAAAAQLLSTQALAAVADNQADKARALLAMALRRVPQSLHGQLAEATIVVDEGDLTKGMVLVEAILAATPESGKAWGIKGQVLAQQGKLEDARAAFSQAIAHSNMVFPERLARALISLQLQDYAAAQSDATKLLEQSPKDPAANYVQGILHIQGKQYRKAITALTLAEPAAEQFPQLLYYLSMSYLIENDLKHAARYGSLFVKSTPSDSRGRQLLAAIMVGQNKPRHAQDALQPALDRDPEDVQALNIMANALLLDDQADAGLALYARIAQLQPDWHFAHLRQEAALVVGEQASQVPLPVPDQTANFPQDDILLILKLLDKKDFQGAIETAKSYQYKDLDSFAPYAVLGRVYVAAGKTAEAQDVFNRALKRDPGNPAANQGLALLARAAHDPAAARRYYQTILEYYEDHLSTLLQLADLESSQNNTAAMVVALKQAVAAHRSALEPRLVLARYYLSAGRPEKVAPLLAKLTAVQQESARVLELTALAQLAQQQFAAAMITLQRLANAEPEVAGVHYLLAIVASEAGNEPVAKEELLAVVQRDPKHIPALIKLARSAHSEGAQQRFEQYLATLVTLAPEAPEVLRLRASAAETQGNPLEALALAQRAFALTPTAQTVQELAAYQTAAGQKEAARSTVQRWLEQHPADVEARLVLAQQFELDKDVPKAQAQYLLILAVKPDHLQALNHLAWSLRLEKPVIAFAVIRRALATAPNAPDLLDTLAVIEHLAGDNASAHRTIERALQGSPGNLTMLFHQAMIEAALGKQGQAIAMLELLVVQDDDTFPERVEAKKLLASLKN